ncbi:MAG: hypothetical protein L6Q54_12265 [Leptospiraceae bacterium]|nr:hypothetical protein [Leptospiraceae bacterium]MCK6382006.1 hypothetical protein [Leptospiraceae bacterium]NUM40377.1 hypothetical protein [Leptospiraceae bacterium]
MNFLKELLFLFNAFPVILKGWVIKTFHAYTKFAEFWNEKSLVGKVLFLCLLIQLIVSTQGWIDYTVNFNQIKEEISVSVRSNTFFILASLFNFFFVGFWKSHWVKYLFYLSQGFCAAIFLISFLFSDFYFVEFLKKTDYEFNSAFYIFIISWVINTILFLFNESQEVRI